MLEKMGLTDHWFLHSACPSIHGRGFEIYWLSPGAFSKHRDFSYIVKILIHFKTDMEGRGIFSAKAFLGTNLSDYVVLTEEEKIKVLKSFRDKFPEFQDCEISW